MDNWIECRIGDVVYIRNGYAFKSKDFSNEGTPLIKIKNVKPNKIVLDTIDFIPDDKVRSDFYIKPDDILLTMSGNRKDGSPESWVGKSSLFRLKGKYLLNQRVSALSVKDNISCAPYIAYYLSSWDSQIYFINNANSSGGQANISPDIVKEMPISLPSLPEQKAIAEVLSSLDDKIDLLHRQNKTLESMAEALFRHHFIDNAQPDWEEKPLSFFGDVICGKTPSKKVDEYYGGTIPFIKTPDMHGKVFVSETTDTLTEEGKNSQVKKTIPSKSICVSCIATVGLVVMNENESHTNQQINSIVPYEEKFRYYIFSFMKASTELLQSMASGGTTIANLNTGNFSKMILPYNEPAIDRYHEKVTPWFDKILHNQQQIITLEKLRDTLLPKLMSGEVRVRYEEVS